MRNVITLGLLFLFLLNVLGYYGVFVGLQLKTAQEMRQNFDEGNYNHQEITFRIPLTIPYSTDSREFNRVDGEFEHNGEIYRLVKQKLQSDTLVIVCVKDNTTKEISQALEDYVKTFSDSPANSKNSSKSTTNFSKDFISLSISIEQQNGGWRETLSFYTRSNSYNPIIGSINSPPPRG